VAGLGSVTRAWQLYPVCLVMTLGWGALSGGGDHHHPGAVVAAGPSGMESGFGQQPRLRVRYI
jgi:hypothetical protein